MPLRSGAGGGGGVHAAHTDANMGIHGLHHGQTRSGDGAPGLLQRASSCSSIPAVWRAVGRALTFSLRTRAPAQAEGRAREQRLHEYEQRHVAAPGLSSVDSSRAASAEDTRVEEGAEVEDAVDATGLRQRSPTKARGPSPSPPRAHCEATRTHASGP